MHFLPLFTLVAAVSAGLETVQVTTAPSQRRTLPGVVDCPVEGAMDVVVARPTESTVVMRPASNVHCNVLFNNKAYRLNQWTFDTNPEFYPVIDEQLGEQIAAGAVRALQVTAELLPVESATADYESITSSGFIWAGEEVAAEEEDLPIPPVGAANIPLRLPLDPERRLFLKEKPKTITDKAVDLAMIKDAGADNKARITLFYEAPLEASDRLNRALHAIKAEPITPEKLATARANNRPAEGVHVTIVRAGGDA